MALISAQDVSDAFANGEVWETFARKIGGVQATTAGVPTDWCLATGVPNFDPRTSGDPLVFYPCVSGNGAKEQLYLGPNPPPGKKRYLHGFEVINQIMNPIGYSNQFYDLVGYYPYIDGDGGLQFMDNSAPFPRYESGDGIMMALLNSVVPLTGIGGGITINFIDSTGASRTTPAFSLRNGQSNQYLQQGVNNGAVAGGQAPFIFLPSGCRGVRSVTSVNFPQPLGGVYALCMLKPIAVAKGTETVGKALAHVRDIGLHSAFMYPEIPDGACINLQQLSGSATSGGVPSNGMYKFTFFYA